MGHHQVSPVCIVTCANAAVKDKIVVRVELRVKGRKCLIVGPDTRETKLKLLWLPHHMENCGVAEALAPFGVVGFITREKRRWSEMEHMETLNREVQLWLLSS